MKVGFVLGFFFWVVLQNEQNQRVIWRDHLIFYGFVLVLAGVNFLLSHFKLLI